MFETVATILFVIVMLAYGLFFVIQEIKSNKETDNI